jgi:hypothetical protein
MKLIVFLTVIALCTVANAQEPVPNDTGKDTSSVYLIKLFDNSSLSGKILERNDDVIIFYDITVGKVTIPQNKIRSMKRFSGTPYCILTTNDGKTFSGQILSQNEIEVTIRTESLGDLTIANAKIKEIKLVEKEQIVGGQYYFPNPHPTRYFFGPSAIPLQKEEGYFQNAWILANSFQIGLNDHFSMGGGIVVPVLFFITPKVGYKVAENVHIGGGILVASTISKDMPFGVGAGYFSVTLGNNENNFTLNAGWGALKQENYNNVTFTSTYDWEFSKRPMFVFAGMARIARKFALLSENWVFSTRESSDSWPNNNYTYKYHSVLSAGFRFLGERNSFDFGLAVPMIQDETIGIPYLDYVFKF